LQPRTLRGIEAVGRVCWRVRRWGGLEQRAQPPVPTAVGRVAVQVSERLAQLWGVGQQVLVGQQRRQAHSSACTRTRDAIAAATPGSSVVANASAATRCAAPRSARVGRIALSARNRSRSSPLASRSCRSGAYRGPEVVQQPGDAFVVLRQVGHGGADPRVEAVAPVQDRRPARRAAPPGAG
jgi:hypothetical protein